MAVRHEERRARLAEGGLIALVVGIVVLLLVPLPPWVLDGLLALNLTAAFVILMVAMAVREPLGITTFPALLLITTLTRLSLNVSSTRLILGTGYAGEVIEAFSSWVVAGSFVVGIVLFLILTAVQFIVIARGGERVAEVAARFALDALPGRQMALDADQRAGVMSAAQAQDARSRLQQEGRLYGAMDGAMKFVKGDAIVGLFILGVDLLGGVWIGVSSGLSMEQAVQHYGRLTIGDGLVSQVPALMLSTSAALVVTRVAGAGRASGGGGTHLGEALRGQLSEHPRAFGAAAALLALLALAPGLPLLPFAAMAIACGAVAWRGREVNDGVQPEPELLELPPPPPLAIEWRGDNGEAAEAAFLEGLQVLRETRGVAVPAPRWQTLPRSEAAIEGAVLLLDGLAVCHLPQRLASAEALLEATEARLASLLTMEMVHAQVERWRAREPRLVEALLPRHVSLYRLTQLLRGLLSAGLSLRALRPVFEAALSEPEDASMAQLLRRARRACGAQFVEQLRSSQRLLVQVGPGISSTLAAAYTPADDVNPDGVLALNPTLLDEVVEAIERGLRGVDESLTLGDAAVITLDEGRAPLALVLSATPDPPPVLAVEELAPFEGSAQLLARAISVDL